MCDIYGMLRGYIQQRRIDETSLTYRYIDSNGKQYNSPDVDKLFLDWNDRMLNKEQTEEKLQNIIAEIFKWGGVGSNKLRQHYAKKLLNNDLTFENNQKTPFSSWSKVAAAYTFNLDDSQKYYIYDSRVAIALNVIIPDYPWYLPEERGHNIVFALIKNSRKKSEAAKKSYERYCNALRERGGSNLERELFMLGKMLDFRPSNDWRRSIIVDPYHLNIPDNQ